MEIIPFVVVTGYTGHAPTAIRVRSPRLHQHSCGESISLFLALVAYPIRRTYSLLWDTEILLLVLLNRRNFFNLVLRER